MGKKQLTDAELDALFEQEQAPKAVPDALMARIMADADAVQNSAKAPPKPSTAQQPSLSFWRFLPTAGALTAANGSFRSVSVDRHARHTSHAQARLIIAATANAPCDSDSSNPSSGACWPRPCDRALPFCGA